MGRSSSPAGSCLISSVSFDHCFFIPTMHGEEWMDEWKEASRGGGTGGENQKDPSEREREREREKQKEEGKRKEKDKEKETSKTQLYSDFAICK